MDHTPDRIMIIDDDPNSLWMMYQSFKMSGFISVEIFTSAEMALDAISRGSIPNVIITDYQMPKMNGLELIQQIEQTHPEVKIFLMSANPELIENINDKYIIYHKNSETLFFIIDSLKKILQI